MQRSVRSLTVVAVAVVLLFASEHQAFAQPEYGDIIGPVTEDSLGIYIPTTLEAASTVTPTQERRIEAAAQSRFPQVLALVAAGRKVVGSVSAEGTTQFTGSSGKLRAPMRIGMSARWTCSVKWLDFPSGRYIWGNGTIDTNPAAAYLEINGRFYWSGDWDTTVIGALTNTSNISADSRTNWWPWYSAARDWTTYTYNTAQETDGTYAAYREYCWVQVSH